MKMNCSSREQEARASLFAKFLAHVNNTVSGPGGLTYTDLDFSMKAGGGVDFNLSPHFAVRVFDADYCRTSLFSAHQNNIWLSTRFVIRPGGAARNKKGLWST